MAVLMESMISIIPNLHACQLIENERAFVATLRPRERRAMQFPSCLFVVVQLKLSLNIST